MSKDDANYMVRIAGFLGQRLNDRSCHEHGVERVEGKKEKEQNGQFGVQPGYAYLII